VYGLLKGRVGESGPVQPCDDLDGQPCDLIWGRRPEVEGFSLKWFMFSVIAHLFIEVLLLLSFGLFIRLGS
jgi:hypothetical protein